MKKQMLNKKRNGGITLIALVITIVVLLILAGVSIAMLTGDNGILTQANKAKEETERAEIKERLQLEVLGELVDGNINLTDLAKNINKNIPGASAYNTGKVEYNGETYAVDTTGKITGPIEGEFVKAGEKVTGEENKFYINNGVAKIPVGFRIVPGCEDVSKGLVISDGSNDTEEDPENIVAEGNQFVWIPVTSEGQYVRNTTYANINVSPTAYTDKDYLPDGIQPEIEASITDVQQIGLINEEAEREAVLSAGGFYIGRYEAGDSSASDHRSSSTVTNTTAGTLVSKKGLYAYSYIAQEDAKAKAKTFPLENNQYVKCALISGIQWDVTMATINGKKDGNGNVYDVTTAANDSTKSDRHTSSPAKTGQNIADKVYNIYDLEGNFFEYVAEKNTYNTLYPYVDRGGYYDDGRYPASFRYSGDGGAYSYYAFRLSLYVM